MSKLREMSENGELKKLVNLYLKSLMAETESRVVAFNAVFEDGNGHCCVCAKREKAEV